MVLALLCMIAFWRVQQCGFINFDDDIYVTANAHVQHGLNLEDITWALTTFHSGNWHPLTWLSLQLDAQTWGPNPAGFHLTNLVLHAINAVLAYVVLLRLSGSAWRSALVAGVWAVHPLRVESVAWVTERKDVLSSCLGLLAILAYAGYARRPGWGRYLMVAVLMVLSLMAKPMLVTLPFLMLVLDFWPLGRFGLMARNPHKPPLSLVMEKLPLMVVSAAFSILVFFVQR